jgi:transcriptional regulator with XRE-family HTH domain
LFLIITSITIVVNLDSKQDISFRLRQWRKSLGLTQIALSKFTDTSITTIRKCEGGSCVPGGNSLLALAKAGLNIHWLLTGVGDMTITISKNHSDPQSFASRLRELEIQIINLDFDEDLRNSILEKLSLIIKDSEKINTLEKKVWLLQNKE